MLPAFRPACITPRLVLWRVPTRFRNAGEGGKEVERGSLGPRDRLGEAVSLLAASCDPKYARLCGLKWLGFQGRWFRTTAGDRGPGLTQSLEELIDTTVLSAGQGFQVLLGSDFKQACRGETPGHFRALPLCFCTQSLASETQLCLQTCVQSMRFIRVFTVLVIAPPGIKSCLWRAVKPARTRSRFIPATFLTNNERPVNLANAPASFSLEGKPE